MTVKIEGLEPAMTGARQTMLTWARAIETFEELPDSFKEACRPILGGIQPFPYVVFAPAIKTIRFPSTQKVLAELAGTLYIWESVNGQIATVSYPLENICQLEIGGILLNSWMSVSGLTTEGTFLTTPVPFNTATLRHFLPLIQLMRPPLIETDEPAWQAQLSRFDALSTENFKFMSFARESLVRGQLVTHTIWQPAIRQPIISLFGHSFDRIITLSHLAILTDNELILIRDDEESEENRGVRYGGVWYYLPLRHIAEFALLPAP